MAIFNNSSAHTPHIASQLKGHVLKSLILCNLKHYNTCPGTTQINLLYLNEEIIFSLINVSSRNLGTLHFAFDNYFFSGASRSTDSLIYSSLSLPVSCRIRLLTSSKHRPKPLLQKSNLGRWQRNSGLILSLSIDTEKQFKRR